MKLGLALSGGGFRASFFHIGVLAAMAGRDLLRHVEVLSTVSGGSIIGALYYLHLRRLLESRHDRAAAAPTGAGALGRADYEALVETMAGAFVQAVQTNIRLRTLENPLRNLRMMSPRYSRSDHIAELYDKLLYTPVLGGRDRPQLRHLKVQPLDGPPHFDPDAHNGERGDKVPILLINATSLNTGRNWRFEAKTMGEPPTTIPGSGNAWVNEVDRNAHLRRPPAYAEMVEAQAGVELGSAVAASAGVPVVFAPLAISGLYPDARVQLVDGGVHDNLGIAALESRGCTHMVVSDASGQLADDNDPATNELAVLFRTNAILMDRVREEQLFRLFARLSPRNVAFVSLRSGLEGPTTGYVDHHGSTVGAAGWAEPAAGQPTPHGVDALVQHRLSRLRTDLDSFTDREAYALMADGYRLSNGAVAPLEQPGDATAPSAGGLPQSRPFQRALAAIAAPETDPPLLRHLEVGGHKVLKVFRLQPWLAVPPVALLAAVLWGAWPWMGPVLQAPLWGLLLAVLVPVLGYVLPKVGKAVRWLRVLVNVPAALRAAAVGGLLLVGGGLLVWLYRHTFDRLYVRLGRL